MPELTLADIARLAGGELRGDPTRVVRGVATLESAGEADLSLVATARYLSYLPTTRAAAVLVADGIDGAVPEGLAEVRVRDPHAALVRILEVLYPPPERAAGIHPTAVIEPEASIGVGVSVGPYAVVGRGARIGRRSRIGPHVTIGEGCTVGEECLLHPQVTLYAGVELGDRCIVHSGARLGADGFGFAFDAGEHRKIPQVGGCRIGDDVEVGANSTIDRGSIGATVVGKGTKIDNLVHVGHNARIGRHVIIVAQTGISGSTEVGDGAVLGGQSGIGGHISIGAGARIGAQAGVIGDVPPGATYSGYPARPHREAMRAAAAILRLPELLRRVQRLEQTRPQRAAATTDHPAPAGPPNERPENA